MKREQRTGGGRAGSDAGRENQRRRTRKDLLAAAARLIKEGRTPDMDEVAAAAMVSRATAYRYFPSVEALMVEAPLDLDAPDPAEVFGRDASDDVVKRALRAESALHEMTYRHERALRVMLAASLERVARGETDVPVRQNRRGPLIDAALAPAREKLTGAQYEKLAGALALVYGTESMIVFRDVLRVDEKAARRIKAWAVKALVEAALGETRG